MIIYHLPNVIFITTAFNSYTMLRRNELWKTIRLLRRKLLVDTRPEV